MGSFHFSLCRSKIQNRRESFLKDVIAVVYNKDHDWSQLIDRQWAASSHSVTLQWRYNGRDCVSNHQPHHCLHNRLFRCRSKKISKLRVTGLCEAERASNAENVSILCRLHGWHQDAHSLFSRLRSWPHGHCRDISAEYMISHYNDVIMSTMASQITSLTIVYSTVYSDVDQRKHQSSASLAFLRGVHRRPVNSPHKGPVTRKMFPFDDVIMHKQISSNQKFFYK